MKKIYLILTTFILMFSCEDIQNPELGSNEQWLQFEDSTSEVSENTVSPLRIPVLYAATVNQNDISVSFTYTSNVSTGFSVSPANGVVTIPAGEFVGYIEVMPVNDLIPNDNIVIEFSIEGNSIPVGIAGQGIYNVTSEVTIIEDDCPIELSLWEGGFSVSEIFTGGTNEGLTLAGAFGEIYQLELALDPTDATGTKMIITNSIGYNEYIPDGTVITFKSCLSEISFDAGNPEIAIFAPLEVASSSFNGLSFSITCTGELTGYGPYQFVITKI